MNKITLLLAIFPSIFFSQFNFYGPEPFDQILDNNFSIKSEGIRGDLGGLFLGTNLRTNSEKYRKLYK